MKGGASWATLMKAVGVVTDAETGIEAEVLSEIAMTPFTHDVVLLPAFAVAYMGKYQRALA